MRSKAAGLVFSTILLPVILSSCGQSGSRENSAPAEVNAGPLPYFGDHDVEMINGPNGERIPDTAYYQIPKFSFTNQDGRIISHQDYTGKIFVADFFFTKCESICPIMSSQMVRLQELLKRDSLWDKVWLLSHTVDPARDTPEVLREYAGLIGADLAHWNFVTGPPEDIYWQAETGYMLSAFPSDTAQGGFFHTDRFTLVDPEMHIRGYYDGTSTQGVDKLYKDIQQLVRDEYAESNGR